MASRSTLPGSFRDPSGFLFVQDGSLYRQVNNTYAENYDHLMESGLYEALVKAGSLIPHEEFGLDLARTDEAYRILKPDAVPFISYPYEWCFSQLKDAALLTLSVQKTALDFGMTLKDASAYNVQFVGSKPVLIDTLSFERYAEGQVWVPYRQFCQHFLAPLALMSHTDVRLSQLLRTYIDGIPLDLASGLLPFRTRLSFSLLSHLHLHARSQKHFAERKVDTSRRRMGRRSFLGIIDSLESAVRKLKWQPRGELWSDYYEESSYSTDALEQKRRLVARYLDQVKPRIVWDLGANVGLFSRVASDEGILTISFDVDPECVEQNYLQSLRRGEKYILPLLLDLTNPSPGIGWEHEERMSLIERGPADTVLCLALIHHLAISNNLPLRRIADFLTRIGKSLIIEWVPKGDPQVGRLLASREDIFTTYTQEHFEATFAQHFQIAASEQLPDSDRTIYLMTRRGP
ncbi:MAG TPA: SAM-dependent methyltransferase [Anaerolineae bacterium]|nr:SAM-dependent methyltransferase [Anaerolineae bacterium]